MAIGPRTIGWGVALGGVAAAFGIWRGFRRPVTRPFLYATRVGSVGAETLHYAQISGGTSTVPAIARRIRTVGTVPGAEPSGAVPEVYVRLVPSPGNQRMAVLSTQNGLDFIDHNIRVIDLKTGANEASFNEHRFSGISRATFTSALFEAFVASEAANGVPADVLAGYDWSVVLEGSPGANIPWPTLAWADDETLIVSFRFIVSASVAFELGEDEFRFRMVPGSGGAAFTQWTAPMPPAPPAGPLSIGPNVRPNPGVIRYKAQPLPFVATLPFPPPNGPRPTTSFKRARLVAGLVG